MTTAYVRITPRHYTPRQIAAAIGCSRQTVIAMIERGEIRAEKTPGGHHRIPATEVEGVLEARVPVVNVDALA